MAFYFGKICPKHPELKGERRAHNRDCVACAREYGREYSRKRNAANPEKNRERTRKWAAANPEKRLETRRKAYAANPKKFQEKSRKWNAANPAKRHAMNNRWVVKNPEMRAANTARRRASKINAVIALTPTEQLRLVALYAKAKRLTKETGIKHSVDHDKPLARGGVHHPDNMLVITAAMNSAKGAFHASTLDFILS